MPDDANKADAMQTYARRRGEIARLLDVLGMELEVHAEELQRAKHPWGLAGDLEKVRADLIEAVGFIAGMNTETVEEFLAEPERPWPSAALCGGGAEARGGPPPALQCPACGRRIDIVRAP